MKKIAFVIAGIFSVFTAFAQTHNNVYVEDEIYQIIDTAQLRGLCSFMGTSKPYTEYQVLKAINQILDHEDKLKPAEIEYLREYKETHNQKAVEKNPGFMHLKIDNKKEGFPVSFLYDFGLQVNASGGLYTDKKFNQFGVDIIPTINFRGDISKYLSYRMIGSVSMSTMPLYKVSDDYFIGYSWYNDGVKEFLNGEFQEDGTPYPEPKRRTITKYLNNSYLPYSYSKPWDGSIYLLTNLSTSGLEGWATEFGMSGFINGEINLDFFDSMIQLKAGRQRHEYLAMDVGSSLVLNKSARPFFAGELLFQPFEFIKFSSLTGMLEYPNNDYIYQKAYPQDTYLDDAYFWQNCVSLNMLELDFPYFHFDFGSSTIWPKRTELAYLFPLINYVFYQNNVGDYDNTALFGDIKLRKPGVGAIWASLFLDEINGLNNDPTTSTRAMFAGQLGGKIVIPWLPFATVSLRYTKVEPYCYTHQAVNYTPWYNQYICENYTNNGSSLGYYLDPNSDETLLRFDVQPTSKIAASFQYQFIRHGADYGSQQVPGSSLYSELSPKNREELKKYFLHDGAYNWMHIINVSMSYTNRKSSIPFSVMGSAGFMYSYYTAIDQDIYDRRHEYGNNGNSGAGKNTPFHIVNSEEYPIQCGFVLTLGLKLWNF